MKIKLFAKDITDDKFYLMVCDSLDAYIETKEPFTEELALSYAEDLKEDIAVLIDKATEDWINDQIKEGEK